MALDLWINEVGQFLTRETIDSMVHVDAFEHDEAHLVFLVGYWVEYEERFGPIDPWGNLLLFGASLDAFLECLQVARTQAALRPTAWLVHTSSSLREPRQEIYTWVQRDELIRRIEHLADAARRAREAGKQLLFFGD